MFCGPANGITRGALRQTAPRQTAPRQTARRPRPSRVPGGAIAAAGVAGVAISSRSRGLVSCRAFEGQTLEGQVKSFNEEKGFGFIECPETFNMFKRDVFLHRQQANNLAPGDAVTFEVELNAQGRPQARNVIKIVPAMLGIHKDKIEDAWAAAEAERETEEETDPIEDAWAMAEASLQEETQEVQASHAKSEVDDSEAKFLGVNTAVVSGAQEAERNKRRLEEELADAKALADQKEYARKSTMLARFTTIVDTMEQLRTVAQEASDARQLASQYAPNDEMHELALEEARELREKQEEIAERLQKEMLTPDERDQATSVLVEIRPGVGGDEACLWAEDLSNMYQKYCSMEGLRCKFLSYSRKEGGGLQEATLNVQGEGAWMKLKYESGVHRVQRVPSTEKMGRVHTSTATVAIMPEVEETSAVDEENIEKEIKYSFCRSGGKGGQNVNKVETAVHATHQPTGIHFFVTQERSQLQNRAIAVKLIVSKLKAMEQEAAQAEEAEMRASQIGSGGRSEKSRSYNFKENRVTDHRLNQNFPLSQLLEGNLQEAVRLMALQDERQRLEAFERNVQNQKLPA